MPRERRARRKGGRRPAQREETPERSEESRPLAQGVWSGSVSFGLVTIPIELFSASRRSHVALRQLGPDGAPLARRYVCSADARRLSDDEIGRGYETDDGSFVLVTDEELEKLAPRRSRDIELVRFVDRDALDPLYFVRPYVVLPGGEQTRAYGLLAETMEAKGRAAIGSFVMRGKSHPIAIFAERGVLRGVTLRYHDELRSLEGVGVRKRVKIDPAQVAKLKRSITKLAAEDVDAAELRDPEAGSLLALAREKHARDEDVVRAPDASEPEAGDGDEADGGGAEVIDLFATIRERLREPRAKGSGRRRKAAPSRGRPRVRRRRARSG